MLDIILFAIPLGLTLSVLVGPVFFILIQTSITKGARAALVLDIGVVLADIFYIAIAFYSSKQLLQDLEDTPSLFLIGGAVIFVFGLSSVVKKDHIDYQGVSINKTDYLGLIAKGFFLNAINIGVLIFWLGAMVIAGHKLNFEPVATTVYFGTVIATYLVVDLIKIALAKEFKKKLTDELLHKVKRVIGMILMFFGIMLSMKAFVSEKAIADFINNIF
ncbi:MAG: LysE family transporter [Flavobacteriales bacterium]|nr:LysE family transporter [Flavobacteriales bacterium]